MTYISVAGLSRWPNLFAAALLCIAVGACDSGSGAGTGGTGGTAGTGGPMGCLNTNFRDQPDVLVFPLPPRQVGPGGSVEFNIFVDSDTRLVKATLMGAWRLDPTPPAPAPSEMVIVPTTGNVTIVFDPFDLDGDGAFAIPITTTGRYYVEMELCGSDCDELSVLYTLDRRNAGEGSDAINDPYERIVFEGGVESGPTSFTCDKPRSVAVQ
jgi:hypothetical protein